MTTPAVSKSLTRSAGARLLAELERSKWLLWHGNQHRAHEAIETLEDDVDGLEVDYPNLRKFAKSVHEFAVYIKSNTGSLINYGERFRAGERISSCPAESTVNAVISKRFAKRQQMQWTKRGAHLLLQTRTRTLDGTLRPLAESIIVAAIAIWAGATLLRRHPMSGL
jgi:hypothetical protein